ncbi:hypothetical protein LCGC14_1223940, partial [marine sediment metagenome]
MRRIAIIVLLLCSGAFGAATTWNNGNGTNIWNDAANWTGAAIPGAADDVTFDNTSDANCTMDAAPTNPIIQSLTIASAYDGVLDFSGETLDIDGGNCSITGDADTIDDTGSGGGIECEGNFTISGAPLPAGFTVTLNGNFKAISANVAANLANLIIDSGGNYNVTGAATYWGSVDITANIYETGSRVHTIAGSIVLDFISYDNGGGKWIMNGNGTFSQIRSSVALVELEISAGVTCTVDDGSNFVKKVTLGAGSSLVGSATERLDFLTPSDNFWTQPGDATCSARIAINTTNAVSTGGAMTLDNEQLLILKASNGLTVDGHIDLGTGNFRLTATSGNVAIDMVTFNLTCDDIVVGESTNDATLDLGTGTHTVTGNIADGASMSGTATFNVATSSVTLTGTFDGDSIAVTGEATGGLPAVFSGSGSSATIQNVNVSVYAHIDARGIAGDSIIDGGNNR